MTPICTALLAGVCFLAGYANPEGREFLFAVGLVLLFAAIVLEVYYYPPDVPPDVNDFPEFRHDCRRAVVAPPAPSTEVVSTTPGYWANQSTVSSRTPPRPTIRAKR